MVVTCLAWFNRRCWIQTKTTSPAIIITPRATPIPIPAFAPVPRPDAEGALDTGEDVAEVAEDENACDFNKITSKVVDKEKAYILLPLLERLATISLVLSKKTP